MYSLEQRMTACCSVFSGEFFTCTGCWRQPGSWGGSRSLNNCTVMRKRTSSVLRQSESNHPFTHSQDVVKWSASWLIRPLVFSLGRVGIGGRGGGLKPQLPDALRFSFLFLLKSRSRSSRMSLPFSLLLHPVMVYLSTNANKPPPLANVYFVQIKRVLNSQWEQKMTNSPLLFPFLVILMPSVIWIMKTCLIFSGCCS